MGLNNTFGKMTIYDRKNKKGRYFQWNDCGKKYYYKPKDIVSKYLAKEKARKQAQRIYFVLFKNK